MHDPFQFARASRHGWLANADPRLKIVWVACLSLAAVLVDSLPELLMLFLASLAGASGLRLSARGWAAVGGSLLAIAFSTMVSQGIFYGGVPRTRLFTLLPPFDLLGWQLSGIHFYREGALYGLAQSLRWLSLSMAGLSVCLSTSPERLLSALVTLGAPAGLAFIATTALRFLPTMLDEWATVRRARWLRGDRGRWRRLPTEISLFPTVLSSALRRAATLATSVSSRGFSPTAERTFYPELRMRPLERAVLACLIACVIGLALSKSAAWFSTKPSPAAAQGLAVRFDLGGHSARRVACSASGRRS